MPLTSLTSRLAPFAAADPLYASQVVEACLEAARELGASDIHWQPGGEAFEVRFRLDGVLQTVATLPRTIAPNVVGRLKVMADLLTYRTDCPQEGRLRGDVAPSDGVEMRVSTFPTLFGEKAVVRLFGAAGRLQRLDELGLTDDVLAPLRQVLAETSGAVLVSGPAGSGKTTTAYACLRELAAAHAGARSLTSIEDPIETAVPGVAQSQVNLPAGFDLATGLRFLMRQDPEVILVGEIRDRPTAEAALQASLTGHLVLSTFHAGSAAETVGRLLDMGLEPYVLRSGLLAILNQRLLRRLCACAEPCDDPAARLGLPVTNVRRPKGCAECGGTGYRGRMLIAELLRPGRGRLGQAVLSRVSTARLERLAMRGGMVTRWQRAAAAVEAGLTSPEEVRRVLGFGDERDRTG